MCAGGERNDEIQAAFFLTVGWLKCRTLPKSLFKRILCVVAEGSLTEIALITPIITPPIWPLCWPAHFAQLNMNATQRVLIQRILDPPPPP